MRIALILPLNISFAPYLSIYTRVLDTMPNIEYDIIYCDKKGLNEPAKYRFDVLTKDHVSKINKLIYYYRYSRFLLRALRKEQYDKLIVFGPQIAIFIQRYLCKHYTGQFIMDYRDLSIDQYFKKTYLKILNASALNVISSPGFKEYLPDKQYILSHNFDINILQQAINDVRTQPYTLTKQNGIYHIITNGRIRDIQQNTEVIQALANNDLFKLTFAGRGFAVPFLKKYVNKHNINNVQFTGIYDKQDEPDIIKQATFLNIYYPLQPFAKSAISNRFYNSLIFRKPMITTTGTLQAHYAEKYGIGISVNNTSQLADEIIQYDHNFNWQYYEQQRLLLLKQFKDDYLTFVKALKDFVEK